MKKLAEQHPSLDPQKIERVFVGRSGYDKNKIPKTSAAREARRWSHKPAVCLFVCTDVIVESREAVSQENNEFRGRLSRTSSGCSQV